LTQAIIFALLAALGWGTSAIFVRLGLQNLTATTGTAISLAVGTILIGIVAVTAHGPTAFNLNPNEFAWIVLLGVLNYVLGRYLNFNSVNLAGISRSAPLLASAPLVAVAMGILIGGETINSFILLGTLSIFGGVILVATGGGRG
jgi:uncharacterized membrane protein